MHIYFIFSFLVIGCYTYEINPTILIDNEGTLAFNGIQMSAQNICQEIIKDYEPEQSINLYVSKKANLQSIANLKYELRKAKLLNIVYASFTDVNSDINLNGKWRVTSMTNTSIYALEEKDHIFIAQTLEIIHNHVSNATNLSILEGFETKIPCIPQSIESISRHSFFELYRFDLRDLNPEIKSVMEITTNYQINHPLNSILYTDTGALIIGWDGLYLLLEK